VARFAKVRNIVTLTAWARPDGRYCWVVASSRKASLSGLAGVESGNRDEFVLEYWTNPDNIRFTFVPEVGITKYEYHHHGTVADTELQLVGISSIGGQSQIALHPIFTSLLPYFILFSCFPNPRKLDTEQDLYDYALRILMRRAHSVHEMKQKLLRRADSELLAQVVLARLKRIRPTRRFPLRQTIHPPAHGSPQTR